MNTNIQEDKVGYIGVDVLTNATIINELTGLLRQKTPLDIVSIRQPGKPVFHVEGELGVIRRRTSFLYPIRPMELLVTLLSGPFLFPINFWRALGGAIFGSAPNLREKGRLFAHFFPALVLARRWRKENIGHIHAQWAHTATTVALHASRLLGVGFSFTGHANDLFVHKVALGEKVRAARFVVSISNFHKGLYLQEGAKPENLPVVYCGIDGDRFQPRTSWPGGVPVLLGVGRLVEKKGFHHLIESCASLRDRGLDFRCIIAGSGPEEDRLRGLVHKYQLEEVVEITGHPVRQDELPGLLADATLMVLPCVRDSEGDMDGLPQVLMEAMSVGVPVISTRLVGIPDLVRHGVDGWLVESDDVSALTEAMADALNHPAKLRDMGDAAALQARQGFHRDEYIAQMSQLFRVALKSAGRSWVDFARIAEETGLRHRCMADFQGNTTRFGLLRERLSLVN